MREHDDALENALRRIAGKRAESCILTALKKPPHYLEPTPKRTNTMLAARQEALQRLATARRLRP